MRFLAFVATAALLFTHAPAVAAQYAPPLAEVQPGARVRVEAPGIVAGKYVGTVLTRNADTLTLGSPSAVPVKLPVNSIRSLEISRGKSRSAGAVRGILWGVPIGVVLGVFSVATADNCDACFEAPADTEAFALFTASGLLWGAGIGALVGRERWERFALPAHTAFRIGPHSASLAVVLPR
jgi:hypothetical protein